jgi:hypothetical protein
MDVKSAWLHGTLSVAMAIGMICAGISVSPEMAAGKPQAKPNCGTPHPSPRTAINNMSGKKLSLTGDPTYACHGDSVQWDNSANSGQSYQIIFKSDPFQKGGKYDVPAGQTLTLNVPSGAKRGKYKYSVCATSCSAAGTARLDPRIIIM